MAMTMNQMTSWGNVYLTQYLKYKKLLLLYLTFILFRRKIIINPKNLNLKSPASVSAKL